jgi:hypothetical protein
MNAYNRLVEERQTSIEEALEDDVIRRPPTGTQPSPDDADWSDV